METIKKVNYKIAGKSSNSLEAISCALGRGRSSESDVKLSTTTTTDDDESSSSACQGALYSSMSRRGIFNRKENRLVRIVVIKTLGRVNEMNGGSARHRLPVTVISGDDGDKCR